MIPKIVHFVFGMTPMWDSMPFHLIHRIAVQSAHEVIKPDKIFMYYKHAPNNENWDEIQKYVELVPIEPPTHVFDHELELSAHKADVVRLSKLNEIGGIYLDIDTICLNPLDDLLQNNFVMGKQDNHGLCNAVMLAEKNSDFGNLWFNQYKTFYMPQWDYHSVQLPLQLASQHPNMITVLEKNSFFNPSYFNTDEIFDSFIENPSKYVIHLWEHISWEKYIKNIDVNWIRTSKSTYAHYARQYI